MKHKYDFVIVGAGLFGAIVACEATKSGKKCLVIDKRPHIGGNCYTETIEGINVHTYGAHIFHTNNKLVWHYMNSLVEFNRFTNSPIAKYYNKMYNLPFNMNTFHELWGVKSPQEAKEKIEAQKSILNGKTPENLEEQAISLVGTDIYEKLIKSYTEKQWGRKCCDLPTFIIKRLPVRFNFDNNYFNDSYQGIPIGGYTNIFKKLLTGIEVILNCDYFSNRDYYETIAKKIIYTGPIDAFFNYKYGALEYRSLRFENEVLDIDNYQGNAVVNYNDSETQFTRIIEHKHFEFGTHEKTIITKEYPKEWKLGDEPYYPVNNEKNNSLFKKYKDLSLKNSKKYIFGGRLADYKYYDMDKIVEIALSLVKSF